MKWKSTCRTCDAPIFYDGHSGYWMHSQPFRDGKNGLYCVPEAWEMKPSERIDFRAEPCA